MPGRRRRPPGRGGNRVSSCASFEPFRRPCRPPTSRGRRRRRRLRRRLGRSLDRCGAHAIPWGEPGVRFAAVSCDAPAWTKSAWTELKAEMPKGEDWYVWIDWYMRRACAAVRGVKTTNWSSSARPLDVRDNGPAAANAWIKRICRGADGGRPAPASTASGGPRSAFHIRLERGAACHDRGWRAESAIL